MQPRGRVYTPDPISREWPGNEGLLWLWAGLPELSGGLHLFDVRDRLSAAFPGGTSNPTWAGGQDEPVGLNFDGLNDYVLVPNPSTTYTQVTVAAHFRYDSSTSSSSRLAEKGANNEWTLSLRENDGVNPPVGISLINRFAGNARNHRAEVDLTDGQTYVIHATIAADGKARIYRDGVLSDTAVNGANPSGARSGELNIGRYSLAGGYNGRFRLYGFALHDRAMDDSQVMADTEQWLLELPDVLNRVTTKVWSFGSIATISPDSASHVHTTSSPTISQAHEITPDSATHGHTATSPAITQTHEIAIDSATHAHQASSPSISQTHILSPDGAIHDHTATSPTLTSEETILPSDSTHSHTASSPSISQIGVITPDGGTHGHSASSPTITQLHVIGVDGASHAHAASSPLLTQLHLLSPTDAFHGNSASEPSVGFVAAISPSETVHGHSASSPSLLVTSYVTPDSASHGHLADSPSLFQTHIISPASASSLHTASSPILEGGGTPIEGFMRISTTPFAGGASLIAFKPSMLLECVP